MEDAMHLGSSSGISLSSSALLGVGVAALMILLIVILILIACKFKPWRRFLSPSRTRRRYPASLIKDEDVKRPLVSGVLDISESQINVSSSSTSAEQPCDQTQGGFSSMHSVPVKKAPKPKPLSASLQSMDNDSVVLDIPNACEDSLVSHTFKSPPAANQFAGDLIHEKSVEIFYTPRYGAESDVISTHSSSQGSVLMLEVISGPSRGLKHSVESTNASELPLTIGRVSPCDIILKDSEVSGKHAMMTWNASNLKWELVDMGSLNGTTLNSQAVHLSQSGSRHWSSPSELSSGDIITLGTSSKILVRITVQTECKIPFGIGVASDPMAMRRGGKKLPMEDVCYYHWPLPGLDQFGLFGICDGHGGADAATFVSKIMPEVIAGILSDSSRRDMVLSQCNASDILREAFYETEARITHYYEGCTATVLLVWADGHENCYVQCANVGDSACVVNIDGRQVKMTEDHRISSYSERLRIQALGTPLRNGETRICGINLARMLGDKFLKEQDNRFSSEPYISDVVYIDRSVKGFAIMASDGFWDVVNAKKAAQLVHQTIERNNTMKEDDSAEKIAKVLLNEARTLRTKDNTSIIFLDFTTNRIQSSNL